MSRPVGRLNQPHVRLPSWREAPPWHENARHPRRRVTTVPRAAPAGTCSASPARGPSGALPREARRPGVPSRRRNPLEIGVGPQLFLDDYLIDRLEGLERRAESPERLEGPVLDSKTFGCTQPYVTVTHDRERHRFRLWYNHGPAVWHAESEDGVRWANPRVAWDLPRSYGASLVDDGERARDPERRYKLANWQATRAREDRPGDDGGMYVGFSPDGFRWTADDEEPGPADLARGLRQADAARRGRHRRRLLRPVEPALRGGREGARGARGRLCARPPGGKGYPPTGRPVDEPGLPPLGATAADLRAGRAGRRSPRVLRHGRRAPARFVADRPGARPPRRPALRPRRPEGRDRLLGARDQPGRHHLAAPSRAVPGPQPRARRRGTTP